MNLWTGIACLIPDPNCKEFRRFGDDGKGAYVNVVAWADSKVHFLDRVRSIVASDLDCILLELEHIQSLDKRLEEPDCPEELSTMRTTAYRQPEDIMFGTFHTWVQNDAN